MPAFWLQWGPILATGSVMTALGIYSAFFGLHAERRRARLIYGLTVFAYATWIYPALLGLVSSVLFIHPEPQALRIPAAALQASGFAIALYVSGRHAGYVFRIVCCSIGILAGLVLGVALRFSLGIADPVVAVAAPLLLAAALGWVGWRRGGDIRAAWKIVCFAAAGAGMAASGAVAMIVAWLSGDPIGQWFDLVLSILSPPLKLLVSGISWLEMLASLATTGVVFVLGAATQCRQLHRLAPRESSVCNLMIDSLRNLPRIAFDRRRAGRG